jgi:hypothetical protein
MTDDLHDRIGRLEEELAETRQLYELQQRLRRQARELEDDAVRQRDAARAALADVLAEFDAIRTEDGTGEITHYQARVLPRQYEQWQTALTAAGPGPGRGELAEARAETDRYRHLRAVAAIHFNAIGHLINDAGIRLPDNVVRMCQILEDELTLTLDVIAEQHPALLGEPAAGPAATQATDRPTRNAGPSVAECAANDRAYWERKDAREGQ